MFACVAIASVVGSACANLEATCRAEGRRPTDEEIAGLDRLVARAKDAMAQERIAYEDAGLISVYPRVSRPAAPEPQGWFASMVKAIGNFFYYPPR